MPKLSKDKRTFVSTQSKDKRTFVSTKSKDKQTFVSTKSKDKRTFVSQKCKHINDYLHVLWAFDTHEITQRKCPDCGKTWKPKQS